MILDLGNEEYNQLIELLQTLDADNSGKIDYSEFINLCIEKKKLLSKENLKITF
jgi:Ca2+-binding EF-hand superfamily protein